MITLEKRILTVYGKELINKQFINKYPIIKHNAGHRILQKQIKYAKTGSR